MIYCNNCGKESKGGILYKSGAYMVCNECKRKEELKVKINKEKICEALEEKTEEGRNEKCYLLIIPFSTPQGANIPEVRHLARNFLEVDDNFYEELLGRYKLFKDKQV